MVIPLASQMHEIKATAPDEVTITLGGPNADLPAILAVYQFVIVKDGTTDFSKGIGTGPFRCKEFSPGVRVGCGAQPGLFPCAASRISTRSTHFGIADEAARVNALLSGDIEIAAAINPRSAKQIQAAKGYQVFETKAGNYTDLILRLDVANTGNPDFVMAMKYLLDRERMQERGLPQLRNNRQRPADRPDQPDVLRGAAAAAVRSRSGEVPSQEIRAGEHDGAGRLLGCGHRVRGHGGPDAGGGAARSASTSTSARADRRLLVQLLDEGTDGYGNINPRPTADILLSLFFKSDAPWNESRLKDPKFDALLLQSRAETDLAKRKQMFCDMQKMISDQAGIGIPVFISMLDAYATQVKGLVPVPTGDLMGFNFAQHVWLD